MDRESVQVMSALLAMKVWKDLSDEGVQLMDG
jgi:hypothetical protein